MGYSREVTSTETDLAGQEFLQNGGLLGAKLFEGLEKSRRGGGVELTQELTHSPQS